ncbi:MAG: hypothetical protein ACE5MI_01370 [Acidimicrobiia bacterium]
MSALLLAALLFIDLGATFQNASAFGDARGDAQLFIDIQVEVREDFTTVVAHFVDPGDDQQTVSLARRGEGAFYGGQAVVERANLIVVFEGIRADRTSELSEPTDLIALGVDPDLLGTAEARPIPEDERGTPAWVWLALAVVAAVLSGLALWAMKDYTAEEKTLAEEEAAVDEAGEPAVTEPPPD